MEEIESFTEKNNKKENISLIRIGNLIKEARLSRDQSIEELASDLKIGVHQLKSIEEGNEEELPEKVFIQAMVRRISQKLKIDIEFTMDELKKEKKDFQTQEKVADDVKKDQKSKQSKKLNPVSFLILILVSGFFGLMASSLIFNLLSEFFQNQTPKQEFIKKTK